MPAIRVLERPEAILSALACRGAILRSRRSAADYRLTLRWQQQKLVTDICCRNLHNYHVIIWLGICNTAVLAKQHFIDRHQHVQYQVNDSLVDGFSLGSR